MKPKCLSKGCFWYLSWTKLHFKKLFDSVQNAVDHILKVLNDVKTLRYTCAFPHGTTTRSVAPCNALDAFWKQNNGSQCWTGGKQKHFFLFIDRSCKVMLRYYFAAPWYRHRISINQSIALSPLPTQPSKFRGLNSLLLLLISPVQLRRKEGGRNISVPKSRSFRRRGSILHLKSKR